jgi:hypothetical protein
VSKFQLASAHHWPQDFWNFHPRAKLYRLELKMFLGYLIYIYVANKELFTNTEHFWKIQLNRVSAKLEQNNNHNIYYCPRFVWHLFVKLLFLMRKHTRFCSPFLLFCHSVILMTKILRKYSKKKVLCNFVYWPHNLPDLVIGKLLFGGIVKSKVSFFKNAKKCESQTGIQLRMDTDSFLSMICFKI